MYFNEKTQSVFCVNDDYPFLTIGNKYQVLSNMDCEYLIEDDNGLVNIYKKEHFITLKEKRDLVIDSLT